MEQDAKESTGITRSQHSVLILPHDRSAVAAFLGAALEKVDVDAAEAQLLVLTPDAESTALVSGVASELAAARGVDVVPATSVKRAIRLLSACDRCTGPQPQILSGADQRSVCRLFQLTR